MLKREKGHFMTCLVCKNKLCHVYNINDLFLFIFSIWMNKSYLVQNNCLQTCTLYIFSVPNLNIDNLLNIKSVDDRLKLSVSRKNFQAYS